MTGPAACGLGALKILELILAYTSKSPLDSERIRHGIERIEASLYLRGRCCVSLIAEHVLGGVSSR